MKKIIYIIILSSLFAACKTQEPIINVVNINDATGLRSFSNQYTLPKTVIRVRLILTKTVTQKGPYYQYAKKLLRLKDIIKQNKTSWEISKIDFLSYPLPDSNMTFIIEPKFENFPGLSYTRGGYLYGINLNKPYNDKDFLSEQQKYSVKTRFEKILSVQEENDQLSFDHIPLLKGQMSNKSDYEKAKELTGKILSLRDDRAAILVGDGYTENMPDGPALKIIVSNLNKSEKMYLSMFKGKKISENFQYTFDFVPDQARKFTQTILFRFSTSKGVVPFNDVSGMPVILEINSTESVKKLIAFNKKQNYLARLAEKKPEDHGFYYRLPEMALIKLLIDDEVLSEKKIMIAQFGEIKALSPQYFNGNYMIEFYPDLGSIKNIIKIKKEKVKDND